ncbi:hypothetical protein [Yoonia sp. BS5-3]|uniref:Uncharacterized protein n=1 Tax=Yoonia phaeophyticola TaxID=3137369 RepID=A0ABZ2VBV1_9RHOB
MSDPDEAIGMPRVAWAIGIGLIILCVIGIVLASAFEWQDAPWIVGSGTALAILSGVLFILLIALALANGALPAPIEPKEGHNGGDRSRACDDTFGFGGSGGGGGFGD